MEFREPAWNSSYRENTRICLHFAPLQKVDEGDDGPSDPGAKSMLTMIPITMIPKVTADECVRRYTVQSCGFPQRLRFHGLIDQSDHLAIERRNVVGFAAGHQGPVMNHFLVDPFGAGIREVRFQRGP